MSDSLQPRESQHARPPCPSPTPGVHSDSRPSSQWCHPAISSSVVPFSSCPQSLPASESFPMSQLFAWGGQSTGVSALASFLTKKYQGWSLSEWTGWISLQFKGLSRVFSNTTVQKHQFFSAQPSSQSNSNTQKNCTKKDLHDPDNDDRVFTHQEPDMLECEVKWALGSTTMNKASGGDGIPVELFQILKDDAVKVLHSICQQIWKTQLWPQDWKRSVFILIPKKGNAKECSNYCTIAFISHASKAMLKILQARL